MAVEYDLIPDMQRLPLDVVQVQFVYNLLLKLSQFIGQLPIHRTLQMNQLNKILKTIHLLFATSM